MSHDAFNDSIIMQNVGGGNGHIELDLEPQDVIDTEFVDTPAPVKSRKKLYLSLAIAGVVVAGAVLYQVPIVQQFLGGPPVPINMAEVENQPPSSSANPFAALPVELQPTNAPVSPTVTQNQEPLPAEQNIPIGNEEDLVVQGSIAVDPPDIALLEQQSIPTTVQVTAEQAAAEQAAAEQAAAEQAAAEKAAAEQAAAEQAAAEKAAAEKAAAQKKVAAEKAAAQKAKAEKVAAERRATQEREARSARRDSAGSSTASSGNSGNVVREIMVVTAEQIGLRAFTGSHLIVSTGGSEVTYRVNDHLPSGEKIEQIDPVAMTVVTDRTVIRVKN